MPVASVVQSANPCTTVDVPSIGRRRTVRYPLVRLHVPHPPMLGCHARWWSCRGHSGWVLLSAAGVWSFSKPWRPQGGQAGDQSGQRSHLVESPLGKEAKCARSGVVRARGRRPDQPRPTPRPRQGTHRGTWGLMGRGCRYVCGPTFAACLGLWFSVGSSQALLSSRGPPGDSRRWWVTKSRTLLVVSPLHSFIDQLNGLLGHTLSNYQSTNLFTNSSS